ncbi:Mycothiol maleylpyruvate isomerase N-terminal domain-containing protein [Amycolatopsis arida]|uniref:Mycothiol maleylpyruvate isomerase N-terminal domain-containing protein n=1 Tax=Amycolatopsis arida TaxID=587909 RepID=A0A1I5SIH7_9PSEU|nr:maleylpyruvate isomerase N-terminal domain-containing protein [Amycolatopsis arida]TDX96467.1 mycothiol maleylpyruvate isomerase-like protein [Amycolatopsis arida]SFP70535.1 Mycothiol maleylpyruvate isomerase N-terminal domain-containing protein [Amycolatopsis arida]
MPDSPGPVTADDVDHVVRLVVDTLRAAPPDAWEHRAGGLDWTCWETVEHLADDFFAYAAQLGPKPPPVDHHVPFGYGRRRPDGPDNSVTADPTAGPTGLLEVLDACGAFLAAMVRTAPPTTRGFHGFGVSDPEGFAAMGLVEALVHTHDLAEGLGLHWEPPADVCARVLHRLFPNAPATTAPWPTLLWATGRGELPGHPRLTSWRWYGEPR